jgi:hypothetical protein
MSQDCYFSLGVREVVLKQFTLESTIAQRFPSLFPQGVEFAITPNGKFSPDKRKEATRMMA